MFVPDVTVRNVRQGELITITITNNGKDVARNTQITCYPSIPERGGGVGLCRQRGGGVGWCRQRGVEVLVGADREVEVLGGDRKSTRLNSSH